MKITEFPLGEIPYLAIDRLTTLKMQNPKPTGHPIVPVFDDLWVPSQDWKSDLNSGKATPLVYWYPSYADFLYEIAMAGEDFRTFLTGFNHQNVLWFNRLFAEQADKLDKLAKKTLQLNHLNEATIKNGKLRL